jgi:hypothetical protein
MSDPTPLPLAPPGTHCACCTQRVTQCTLVWPGTGTPPPVPRLPLVVVEVHHGARPARVPPG